MMWSLDLANCVDIGNEQPLLDIAVQEVGIFSRKGKPWVEIEQMIYFASS
jgi:hypothetical protein